MCSQLPIKSFSLDWSEVKPAQSNLSASCLFNSDVAYGRKIDFFFFLNKQK